MSAARFEDPAAAGRLRLSLFALVLLWPLLRTAQVSPGALLDPHNLQVIGGFLAGFLPLAHDAEFLAALARATLETLAIATAGMALAFALALPLALWTSSAGRARRAANPLARGGVTLLRAIPELVLALLFVRVVGLGPGAGVLALGLTYAGMLAKVYAEILESADPAPAQALRRAGSGRLLAIAYGLLPQAQRELASYTVYRWECALRASVVMGFVGAGGLGQLMDQAMKLLNGGEAASILLVFVLLVALADGLSRLLRSRFDAPTAPRAAAVGPGGTLLVAAALSAVGASFLGLGVAWGELFSHDALRAMAGYAAEFLVPDLSAGWLHQVARAAWETLAISAIGTLLAAALGLLLALIPPRGAARLGCNLLRAVPELVWATIAALAVGLGAFAGTLALALHTAGVLGRLYAEALENTPAEPAAALRRAGASRVPAFLYGTLPGVFPQLLAYTLYRWEINIRVAAVLGFIGAGGLGQLLYVELSLFRHAQAATVIFAMVILSIAVDWLSVKSRQRFA